MFLCVCTLLGLESGAWMSWVLVVVGTEAGEWGLGVILGEGWIGGRWWGEFEGKGRCYIHKQRACFVLSKDQMKICQLHLTHHEQMNETKVPECLCVHSPYSY